MPKELILSTVFLGLFFLAFIWGLVDKSVLSELLFLVVAVACVIGHVVTAHLAYNQFKNITEPEIINEEDEDDRKETGSGDGFDD